MPDFSNLWGGQGFGGPFNQFPQPLNQVQGLLQAPSTPGQPGQATPLSPAQAAGAGGLGAAGPGFTQGDLWSRLMNAIGPGGGMKMPGTTVGAPAGAAPGTAATLPPSIPLPQGQAPTPPGAATFLQAMKNAAPPSWGGGNQGLMQQYMALAQMMRGA